MDWILNPLLTGDYPEIMIRKIREKSFDEGRSISRLPEFTEDQKQFIKGKHSHETKNHATILMTYFKYFMVIICFPWSQFVVLMYVNIFLSLIWRIDKAELKYVGCNRNCFVSGTIDFVGINHFITYYITQSDIYGNSTAPFVGEVCRDEENSTNIDEWYGTWSRDQTSARGIIQSPPAKKTKVVSNSLLC